jgi:hypothetical protein
MIEFVSGARQLKNRIKKILPSNDIENLFLNYLAEIYMFWCVVLEKSHGKSLGKFEMKSLKYSLKHRRSCDARTSSTILVFSTFQKKSQLSIFAPPWGGD